MGTSLTGTKPKDTYDSLIKVGDNGPISGTAKVLSDGLGNDLPIAVSTSNVGIGTSAPTGKLQVKGGIHIERASTTDFSVIDNDGNLNIKAATGGVGGNFNITFQTGGAERARITPNGLTFNGDTAAANALDDYEEGTFTPTTAGDPTGAFSSALGEYTKIGNVVHFRIAAAVSANFSDNFIGGLPFTVGGSGAPSGVFGGIEIVNDNTANLSAIITVGTTSVRTYSDNNINNQAPPTTTMGTLRMFGTYRV